MKSISASRTINAPIDKVFNAIADARQFVEAVPDIVNVEFLSEQQFGVGTRFNETREMKGKAQTVTLEVTEQVENEHIRIVSDEGGTVWDTVFSVHRNSEDSENVELKLVMEARPYKLIARIVTPLIFGMVSKAVEGDMDSIKAFCEKRGHEAT